MDVSIIIPTYNEEPNIEPVLVELFGILSEASDIDAEVIYVDDNSPDGTADEIERLKDRFPVKVIKRSGKLGLGTAVLAGFAASSRSYLAVMDGDMSHDPRVLPDLIRGLESHDIMVASRFASGSTVEDWGPLRKLISVVGVSITKILTGVSDPLSGYFALRRSVLTEIKPVSSGYKILFEILMQGEYKSIGELPFKFRIREHSQSKLNIKEHWLFIKQILYYISHKKK